jgi:NAD(P)-dependent dehydrogenase (short-subunit alcohol dehydrogenase family)
MRASGWGRIINVAGADAYLRNHSVYGLAKAGLIFLTEELAVELAPEVTVNAVAPGQMAESAPDVGAIDPTWVPRVTAQTPLGRLVSRSEVAEVVARLCHPAFDMVTGATIPIDGGFRLPRF